MEVGGWANIDPEDRAARPECLDEWLRRRITPCDVVNHPARADKMTPEVEDEHVATAKPLVTGRIKRIIGQAQEKHTFRLE